MELFERNLEALKNSQRDLYDYLCKSGDIETEGVSVETAKNGEFIVAMDITQKIYLNSRYNPASEAEKYLRDIVTMPDEAVLIMFGLANGSFAREFLRSNKKKTHCMVVEPDVRIFYQVIHMIDISDILQDKRFSLIVCGVNDEILEMWISAHLHSYNKKTNRHITLPKYGELFPDKLAWMINVLNERYDKQKIESNTIIQAGPISCKNSFYNLRFFSGCRSTSNLTGRFPEDMPAIVVSAGPSLKKNVHLLEQAKGKAFIICTDSAINTVLATGTNPDMVISVDFAKPVKLFTDERLKDIPFLAGMDLNTEVLEYVRPGMLFITTGDDKTWTRLFARAGVENVTVDGGGSVATLAIANLVQWGFKKIILIGQDLAFTNNMIHVDGNADEEIDINDRDYEFVEGINGDMLPVRKDYFQYLRWIEELGYNNKDIEIIDATEGGAKKRYTTIMTLQEAILKYCVTGYDIPAILEGVPMLFAGEDKNLLFEELDIFRKNLLQLDKSFQQAVEACKRGRAILKSKQYNVAELKRINELLAKVEYEYVNSEENLCITKYIAQAEADMADDMYIEAEDDIAEAIRMYEKAGRFYLMLGTAVPELVEIIDKTILQIKEG